jgi:hypothetical protein
MRLDKKLVRDGEFVLIVVVRVIVVVGIIF